jgi:hypothetical protein
VSPQHGFGYTQLSNGPSRTPVSTIRPVLHSRRPKCRCDITRFWGPFRENPIESSIWPESRAPVTEQPEHWGSAETACADLCGPVCVCVSISKLAECDAISRYRHTYCQTYCHRACRLTRSCQFRILATIGDYLGTILELLAGVRGGGNPTCKSMGIWL